MPGILMTCR
jgi:hypothetical protein